MLRTIRNKFLKGINLCRYRYLITKIEKPLFTSEQMKGYYSQKGQDKWIIEKIFPGKKKGVFVDIGSNDGVTFSNTYLLEKMGWTGLAVEPLPEAYKKLVNNRKCITINGCISPETGKRTFRVISGYAQMLSGLVDEYHPKHIKRIERELGLHGGKYNDIEINCYNLNELLKKYSIFYLDYLSIDIEGSEYKILDNIDFTRIYISVISVENKYSDYRIPRLLIDNGFRFHSKAGDEFYINKKSHK